MTGLSILVRPSRASRSPSGACRSLTRELRREKSVNGLTLLLRDRRGAGTLQMLILAVGLALGGLVAARALGGAASDRTDCAGEQVAAFGGPVPCAGDGSGGDGEARPPEAPPAPEAGDAPEPKEFDPAEELKNLALELLGVTDAIDCFTKGDIQACIFTALSLSPFKAIGIAIKLAKNAKRIQQAVDRFLAARKAKDKADDAKDAAEKCTGGKCDKPGVCFAPGTPVHTERGLVAIEELHAGDLVLSRDDTTGEEAYRPIAQTFVTPDQPLLTIALEDSRGEIETLEVTAPHPFQVQGRGWVAAGDLEPGDLVVSSGGGHLRVASNQDSARSSTVYNFEVEDFHTYFVGHGAAWVHNQTKKDDCGKKEHDPELGGFKNGISADEITDINKRFNDGSIQTGDVSTVLANAARQSGFFNKAASIIRDIAGGHKFTNGNKRTAQAVIEELMKRNNVISGPTSAELRNIIDRVGKGELREVEDIAKALRGF
jgi:hypothetical protein